MVDSSVVCVNQSTAHCSFVIFSPDLKLACRVRNFGRRWKLNLELAPTLLWFPSPRSHRVTDASVELSWPCGVFALAPGYTRSGGGRVQHSLTVINSPLVCVNLAGINWFRRFYPSAWERFCAAEYRPPQSGGLKSFQRFWWSSAVHGELLQYRS